MSANAAKIQRKQAAIAKIEAKIAMCLRQANRKTGASRQVWLDAADALRKSIV